MKSASTRNRYGYAYRRTFKRNLQICKKIRRDVPLRSRWRDEDDKLVRHFLAGCDPQRGGRRGPSRDACEDPLLPSQAAGRVEGLLVAYLNDLIDQRDIDIVGNEAGTDTLDLVGSRLAARENR